MKHLIIGLGNPGAEYEETRHNIGFKVVDTIAEAHGGKFSTEKYYPKNDADNKNI